MGNLTVSQQLNELDELLAELGAPARVGGGVEGGRIVFALDATASRQPTWDRAAHVQGEMFEAVAGLGRLDVQLVFFRGEHATRECRASRWLTSAAELHRAMAGITCAAGLTQIGRVLDHAIGESTAARVGAVVYVGDAMEEPPVSLYDKAGALGRMGTPVFMLQEGEDTTAGGAFQRIAQISGGAHLPFELGSVDRLKALLGGIAAYAAGGRPALERYAASHRDCLQLTSQLPRHPHPPPPHP